MDRKDKTTRRVLIFIIISLLLHVGLVVFFYQIHSPAPPLAMAPAAPQEVVFVNPQDLVQQPPSQNAGQLELADIAKPKVQQVPDKPHFASQYNSKVPEETVARKMPRKAKLDVETSDEEGDKGDRATEKAPPTPQKQIAEKAPEKTQEAPPPSGKEVSLEDLALKPSDFKEFTQKLPKESAKDAKLAKKHEEDPDNLYTAPTSGKPGLPGAGDEFVHDFMPNIKIGDKTYLNAAAFPDVQYFTRLKRAFRMRFNPAPPLRQHLASNRIIVGKVVVSMAMTVSSGGQLTELFVVKSSGIPGYDEEALQTVRQSAPFSAPPDKVLDKKDGKLRMTWSFITYL